MLQLKERLQSSGEFTAITTGIQVTVIPQYLAEQSEPDDQHFVWAYTVKLKNLGTQQVQLINRYWHITDAAGHVQEVRGSGVIGEQPVLESGDEFEYTSGTSLHTASGIMRGTYEMRNDENESFDIEIPAFSLDSPVQYMRPN